MELEARLASIGPDPVLEGFRQFGNDLPTVVAAAGLGSPATHAHHPHHTDLDTSSLYPSAADDCTGPATAAATEAASVPEPHALQPPVPPQYTSNRHMSRPTEGNDEEDTDDLWTVTTPAFAEGEQDRREHSDSSVTTPTRPSHSHPPTATPSLSMSPMARSSSPVEQRESPVRQSYATRASGAFTAQEEHLMAVSQTPQAFALPTPHSTSAMAQTPMSQTPMQPTHRTMVPGGSASPATFLAPSTSPATPMSMYTPSTTRSSAMHTHSHGPIGTGSGSSAQSPLAWFASVKDRRPTADSASPSPSPSSDPSTSNSTSNSTSVTAHSSQARVAASPITGRILTPATLGVRVHHSAKPASTSTTAVTPTTDDTDMHVVVKKSEPQPRSPLRALPQPSPSVGIKPSSKVTVSAGGPPGSMRSPSRVLFSRV